MARHSRILLILSRSIWTSYMRTRRACGLIHSLNLWLAMKSTVASSLKTQTCKISLCSPQTKTMTSSIDAFQKKSEKKEQKMHRLHRPLGWQQMVRATGMGVIRDRVLSISRRNWKSSWMMYHSLWKPIRFYLIATLLVPMVILIRIIRQALVWRGRVMTSLCGRIRNSSTCLREIRISFRPPR